MSAKNYGNWSTVDKVITIEKVQFYNDDDDEDDDDNMDGGHDAVEAHTCISSSVSYTKQF